MRLFGLDVKIILLFVLASLEIRVNFLCLSWHRWK